MSKTFKNESEQKVEAVSPPPPPREQLFKPIPRQPPPPPPPNTPEPAHQVSEETQKLVMQYDTVDEEDLLSSSEKAARADRTPIPPGASYMPGGAEGDSDEEDDAEGVWEAWC